MQYVMTKNKTVF